MKKKIIQIEIEYPDCDELNIDTLELLDIKNETMNQLGIVENVFEGRFKIGVKVVKPINEEELDRLAEEFCDKEYENPTDVNKSQNGLELGYTNLLNCFKAGYRKALNNKE